VIDCRAGYGYSTDYFDLLSAPKRLLIPIAKVAAGELFIHAVRRQPPSDECLGAAASAFAAGIDRIVRPERLAMLAPIIFPRSPRA
jgi:hypothetical protein